MILVPTLAAIRTAADADHATSRPAMRAHVWITPGGIYYRTEAPA